MEVDFFESALRLMETYKFGSGLISVIFLVLVFNSHTAGLMATLLYKIVNLIFRTNLKPPKPEKIRLVRELENMNDLFEVTQKTKLHSHQFMIQIISEVIAWRLLSDIRENKDAIKWEYEEKPDNPEEWPTFHSQISRRHKDYINILDIGFSEGATEGERDYVLRIMEEFKKQGGDLIKYMDTNGSRKFFIAIKGKFHRIWQDVSVEKNPTGLPAKTKKKKT